MQVRSLVCDFCGIQSELLSHVSQDKPKGWTRSLDKNSIGILDYCPNCSIKFNCFYIKPQDMSWPTFNNYLASMK